FTRVPPERGLRFFSSDDHCGSHRRFLSSPAATVPFRNIARRNGRVPAAHAGSPSSSPESMAVFREVLFRELGCSSKAVAFPPNRESDLQTMRDHWRWPQQLSALSAIH